MKNVRLTICLVVVCMMAAANFALADTIRGIGMDFVTIGNAGNAADTMIMYDGTTGYGAVGYDYRIGKYEVTNAQWNSFVVTAGAPIGNPSGAYDESATYTNDQQPINGVSWYESAQFCNWLTSGDKYSGAYNFDQSGNFLGIDRNSAVSSYGTVYVIPTEDEWYKAAYYKPDASGYSLYANGLETIPPADDGWNYYGGAYDIPWDVGIGTQEQNGTFDMTADVWEWNEAFVSIADSRARGGSFQRVSSDLTSSARGYTQPYIEDDELGFRVASIPEPASAAIMTLASLFIALKRRKR